MPRDGPGDMKAFILAGSNKPPLTTTRMSYMEKYAVSKIDPNSKFLNNAIDDGAGMEVTFVGIMDKIREKDSQYNKAGDPYMLVTFTDKAGKERTIDQTSNKGKIMLALGKVNAEPGETFLLSRQGLEKETNWDLKRLSADGSVEVKSDSIPF